MARSVWKGPFVELSLLKKAESAQEASNTKPIKTWSRRSTVLPQFVGLTFNVYNGQSSFPLRFRKKWSATSSVNSRRRARSPVTLPTRRASANGQGKSTPPRGR
jgi:ribosomal protein S19